MDESKFLNIKDFTYRIEIDDAITSVYDEKVKSISNRLNSIKEDVDLYEKLISLSDSEMKNAKSMNDYNTLVSDKEYFINALTNYKNMLIGLGTILNQLCFKKKELNKLISSIYYYNDNINIINEIIKQYNYDIIYYEKNINDLKLIIDFKSKLYNIIYFDYSDINMSIDIDIDRLKKEYNRLSDIENYYNTKYKSNKLKIKEDYEVIDCDDFIFTSKEDGLKSCSDNTVNVDLDYIIYCDELAGKKRSRHKISKIRKPSKWNRIKQSLKKNIRRVISGLLAGVTMIGASSISAGFDKNDNKDESSKIFSTIDSANVENITSNIEETTVVKISTDKMKVEKSINNYFIDEKTNTNKELRTIKKELYIEDSEITIGSSVSASSDIYINATDAYNKENGMTPYYSDSNERVVSLIYYKNNDGNTVLISEDNKDKIDKLKQLKYDVVAYCLDDGWYNKDDVKVLVK